ncbi:MAG: Ig-like domain-containing protein [Gammaproteobacteria bacterium]
MSEAWNGVLRAMSVSKSWAIMIAVMGAVCSVMPVPTYAAVPTSVSITSSADAVASGESFLLSISLNASTASGTFTLYDGSIRLGVFNILTDAGNTAAQVQLTLTPQLAGPYTFAFSAVYSGDSVFASGVSPILDVDVTQGTADAGGETIQTLWLGQAVTTGSTGTTSGFSGYASSAAVSYSNQTETGPCSFYCDQVDMGLAAAPDTVAEDQDIELRASVIDVGFGTPPVFASVQSGDPSGTVTFREGVTILGSADLSSVTDSAGKVTSQASLILSTLSPGEHRITADYGGDGLHASGSYLNCR